MIALTASLLLIGSVQPDPFTKPRSLLRGGDISEIAQVEAEGGRYHYRGKAEDPFVLMRKAGWNFIRLRIWNNPREGWCDKSKTLALAKRAHEEGLKVSIDFHYSDWWADPGKQNKPAAWKDLSYVDLTKAIREYTRDVVADLVAQGTPPFMVQIGNEITPGMLWPDGKVEGSDPEKWGRLRTLIKAGIQGVRAGEGSHDAQILLHIDQGGKNNATGRWWFDNLEKEPVDYDAIGLSYYPWWHGDIANFEANLRDLARRYKKDVYVVELGYPWCQDPAPGPHVYNGSHTEAGFPQTKEGQAAFTKRVLDIVRSLPDGRGKGVLWWAPLWISTPKRHSHYMNLSLFDDSGHALPALDVLGRG